VQLSKKNDKDPVPVAVTQVQQWEHSSNFGCPKCDEVFKKKFPLDLEGQITEFKCPVCSTASEADLPSKDIEQREEFEGDLYEGGEEDIEEDFDESYYW